MAGLFKSVLHLASHLALVVVNAVLFNHLLKLHHLLDSLIQLCLIHLVALLAYVLRSEVHVLLLLSICEDTTLESGTLASDLGGSSLHKFDRLRNSYEAACLGASSSRGFGAAIVLSLVLLVADFISI